VPATEKYTTSLISVCKYVSLNINNFSHLFSRRHTAWEWMGGGGGAKQDREGVLNSLSHQTMTTTINYKT